MSDLEKRARAYCDSTDYGNQLCAVAKLAWLDGFRTAIEDAANAAWDQFPPDADCDLHDIQETVNTEIRKLAEA